MAIVRVESSNLVICTTYKGGQFPGVCSPGRCKSGEQKKYIPYTSKYGGRPVSDMWSHSSLVILHLGSVAQLAERRPVKSDVAGSSPAGPAKARKSLNPSAKDVKGEVFRNIPRRFQSTVSPVIKYKRAQSYSKGT